MPHPSSLRGSISRLPVSLQLDRDYVGHQLYDLALPHDAGIYGCCDLHDYAGLKRFVAVAVIVAA